jgi:hypothetical protein
MYSRSLCEPKNVNSHGQGGFYFTCEVVEIWEKVSGSFYDDQGMGSPTNFV